MRQKPTTRPALAPGAILVARSASLPRSLRLENDAAGTGWAPVAEGLDRRQVEREVAASGWKFLFMTHPIQATAFGFDRQKIIQEALVRLIAAVRLQRCNSLEIGRLTTRSFLGFSYVSLQAHPRHIQKELVFGGAFV